MPEISALGALARASLRTTKLRDGKFARPRPARFFSTPSSLSVGAVVSGGAVLELPETIALALPCPAPFPAPPGSARRFLLDRPQAGWIARVPCRSGFVAVSTSTRLLVLPTGADLEEPTGLQIAKCPVCAAEQASLRQVRSL